MEQQLEDVSVAGSVMRSHSRVSLVKHELYLRTNSQWIVILCNSFSQCKSVFR